MAHKKGMGSTKNGRDSESKRLGAKRKSTPVPMSVRVRTTRCSPSWTAP